MMSQRQGVYSAITTVLGQTPPNPCELTKDQHEQVIALVMEGFATGEIALKDTPSNKAKLADAKELKSYVNGLVNNWLRKDTMLNGGSKYVAKNPGSRAGSGDELIKTLKALSAGYKAQGEEDKYEECEQAIATRKAEIEASKIKEINVDCLPEELRIALGL